MTRGKGARAEHRFDPRLVVRKEGVVRGPVCILFVLIKIATTIEIKIGNVLPLAAKLRGCGSG
jgi:hypothetical protein